jgi:hypothetical protein
MFYPYKTRDVRIKVLREHLLPRVRDHLITTGSTQFDRGANEIFHVEHATEDERAVWCAQWNEIEKAICTRIGASDSPDVLIGMLTRGRELFHRRVSHFGGSSSKYKYTGSLEGLIATLSGSNLDLASLAAHSIQTAFRHPDSSSSS